jgi:hypothetical protein
MEQVPVFTSIFDVFYIVATLNNSNKGDLELLGSFCCFAFTLARVAPCLKTRFAAQKFVPFVPNVPCLKLGLFFKIWGKLGLFG